MKIQNDERFIKGVESLINPMAVSNLLFFQRLKGLLPPLLLNKLLLRAAKNAPYIGFVLNLTACFYSQTQGYRICNIDAARSLRAGKDPNFDNESRITTSGSVAEYKGKFFLGHENGVLLHGH